MQKESLHMHAWLKDVAPSDALRKWFAHDPKKWSEFERRNDRELDAHPEAWQPLLTRAGKGNVTLLYSARDTKHNNAVALKAYLDAKLKKTVARLRVET